MITFNVEFLGIHMDDIQFSNKIFEVMNPDDAILGVSVIGIWEKYFHHFQESFRSSYANTSGRKEGSSIIADLLHLD